MIIRSFTIDGFGIFADQTVSDLPGGVSIFLGDNEAGKSTCLKFFRHILFGFPAQTNKEFCPPLRGGNPGGSLLLDTRAQGQLRLERRPGVRGGPLTLQSLQGERLDAALLETILGGATREVYESVYGFSLSELQDLRSLSGEKVRHALYGASFGTATKPVGQVLKRLDDALNSIYKSSGQNPPLNKKIGELDEVLRQIRDCDNAVTAYEQTLSTRHTLSADLDLLLTEKTAQLATRRELEHRLSLWEQIQRLQTLRTQLAAVSPVIDSFPHEGLSRLDSIRAALAERTTSLATALSKCEQLEAQQRHLGMERHQAILAHQVPIATLVEEKGRYRTLTDQLRDVQIEQTQVKSHIQRLLEELGADWNAGRVRSFDRSVFTRERIEQFTLAIGEASAEADKAREQHETRKQELSNAEADLHGAKAEVQRLGNALAGYNMALVDQLGARREHIQRLMEELPRKKQAAAITAREIDSDIAKLVPDWKREHIRTLDTSFTARESITVMGRSLADSERALHDAQVIHGAAQAQLFPLEERIQQRQNDLHRFATVITKETVDARRSALRALRTALRELAEARQRLTDLTRPAQTTISGGFYAMVAGIMLFALAGAGLLSLSQGTVPLPETLHGLSESLPTLSYLGYALLALAVAGTAALVWNKRKSALHGPVASEAQILLSEADVNEFYEQAQAFAIQAGADTLDETGLDRAEIAIDQMREEAESRDRIMRAVSEMHQERERILRLVQDAGKAIDTARNERDLARQMWNVHTKELLLPATATPDVALSIFDRVEGIRDRLHALETAAQDMAAMQEPIDAYMDLARNVRDTAGSETASNGATVNEHAAQPLSHEELFEWVAHILDDVRRSRETDQDRARATQALHERMALYNRCKDALAQSAARKAAAEEGVRTVQAEWKAWLTERGLVATLSGATAAAALHNVTECVGRLDTLDALQNRIATLHREIAQFAERQDALLDIARQALSLEIPTVSDGTPDRMASVDILSQALTTARDAHAQNASLDRELAGLRETKLTLTVQKQQLEQERATLLSHAGITFRQEDEVDCANAEELFRQHGQAFAIRQTIMQELTPLETSLASLGRFDPQTDGADGTSPASPDQSLTEADRAALEAKLAEIDTSLKVVETRENALREQISDSNATLKGLTTADDVAELRIREAAVREDIRVLSRNWARHALARHLIVEAKKTFERERQPAVIQNASGFFNTITGNTYTGLHTSLDDDSIRALLPSGESRVPEQLSRGTQEQLFLALRLGFILSHSAQREPLPVIMDDILVNFDPGRAAHTAAALAELSQHNQILFFTCHPQTAATLRTAVQDATVFTVQNGTISTASGL